MRTTLVVLGVLLSAVLVACGGDDDGADGDAGASSPTSEARSGDGSGGGGSDAVAIAPFSMPLPPGATHENIRTDIGIQLFYSMDDYDEIVEFFEDWTAAEPETYERFDRDDPVGVGWVWLDDATPQQRTIDVQQSLDAGSFGTVTWIQVVDEKAP